MSNPRRTIIILFVIALAGAATAGAVDSPAATDIASLAGAAWGETRDETATILSGNQAALLVVPRAAGSTPVASKGLRSDFQSERFVDQRSALPFLFECNADDDNEAEHQFCSDMYDAAAANDGINLEYDPNMPHFHLVILPVARDGYTSVAVASSFVYPPLNGLSLSAYLGSFLVVKDMPYDKSSVEIMRRMLSVVQEWMVWAGDRVMGLRVRPVDMRLEAKNDQE